MNPENLDLYRGERQGPVLVPIEWATAFVDTVEDHEARIAGHNARLTALETPWWVRAWRWIWWG